MSESFQPAEDNGETLSKIIMMLLGIFIGGTLTFSFCWLSGFGSGPRVAHVDGAGAAQAMETLPASGPAQADDSQAAYAAQAAAMQQAQMAQLSPAMPAVPQVMQMQAPQVIQAGAPLMLPEQMPQPQTYTTTAPQTLYAGQQANDASHQIGRNGMRTNPCVDPPSCRGRAYGLQ